MKKLALLFGMSENERKGFLVLSMLIVLMGTAPLVYSIYSRPTTDDAIQLSWVTREAHLISEPNAPETEMTAPYAVPRKMEREFVPFSFDPNNLPVEKWRALGFSEKQAQVIKNYEASGGRFRSKEDVAKIYVISDEVFNRIAPYITLPEALSSPLKKETTTRKEAIEKTNLPTTLLVVDIGVADTIALKQIRGIGSVLAARIVNFRDALGGFHTLEQMKEVFGISEEQFVSMESNLVLGDNLIRKLAINDLSVEELGRHPYISRKEAMHIVRYREQHGAFESLADLEEMHALNGDFLRKIAPYLGFD